MSLVGVAGNLGNGLLRVLFVMAIGLMISVQPQAYRDVSISWFHPSTDDARAS